MIFPLDVYNWLKQLTDKMAQTPMRHPMNPSMFVQDESGQVVTMSRSGKVEELIHSAIIQTIPQIIRINPNFLPQDVNQVNPQIQLLQFMEMYGNFVSKFFAPKVEGSGVSNQNNRPTTTTNKRLPTKK